MPWMNSSCKLLELQLVVLAFPCSLSKLGVATHDPDLQQLQGLLRVTLQISRETRTNIAKIVKLDERFTGEGSE